MPISVAIVEDDERVRSSLATLLDGSFGFRCVGTYADAESALAGLVEITPDVVLMDVHLPKQTGIECTRQLRKLLPKVQVVILTVYEDEDRIFEALSAGATGYLLKRTPAAKILEAIEDANRGGSPMSSYIARRVVEFFRTNPAASQARSGASPEAMPLTPREQEILHYLAKGFRYKEIADRLSLSLDTVRTHLRHIYEKLQVHSAAEAVARYLQR